MRSPGRCQVERAEPAAAADDVGDRAVKALARHTRRARRVRPPVRNATHPVIVAEIRRAVGQDVEIGEDVDVLLDVGQRSICGGNSKFAPVVFGVNGVGSTPRPQNQVPKRSGSSLPVAAIAAPLSSRKISRNGSTRQRRADEDTAQHACGGWAWF